MPIHFYKSDERHTGLIDTLKLMGVVGGIIAALAIAFAWVVKVHDDNFPFITDLQNIDNTLFEQKKIHKMLPNVDDLGVLGTYFRNRNDPSYKHLKPDAEMMTSLIEGNTLIQEKIKRL